MRKLSWLADTKKEKQKMINIAQKTLKIGALQANIHAPARAYIFDYFKAAIAVDTN